MCSVRSIPTVRMLPSPSTDPTSGRPSPFSQGKMMSPLLCFAGVGESWDLAVGVLFKGLADTSRSVNCRLLIDTV